MVWRAEDPEGKESAKVMWDIVKYTRGTVLDLGCGPAKTFPHFIGVDNLDAVTRFGADIKPDLVMDCSTLPDVEDASVDAIFSSHLIEHFLDAQAVLHVWWSKIKTGGHLVLYYPDPNEYPRVGQPGSNPDHKADYQPEEMISIMEKVGSWDLLVNERRNAGVEYSIFQVYRKD